MKEIIVTTQAEWNALPARFDEYTNIVIRDTKGLYVELSAARENSQVAARENSQVTARGNSRVTARGNSQVTAWGNSQVEAWENSQVEARENSQVTAWGNSQVTAWENSQVEARENSQVTAWENSQVTARGNSQVTARGNSRVTAWGNSQVTAGGNSQVTAWGNSSTHLCSDYAQVALFMFAVCIAIGKGKVTKKSKTATVVRPKPTIGVSGWLEAHGIALKAKVTVFKRVSSDFKTQENTLNETLWAVGSTHEFVTWNPERQECGPGKFHACPFPYLCDEFRSNTGDRYIAIEVAKKDLFAYPEARHPHKIAFRKGIVLYECDRNGNKL